MADRETSSSPTPPDPERGRRVLLLVTGGIAAYKSCTLLRRLSDHGVRVRVAMTPAATRFVTPMTFEALSGQAVGTTLWGEGGEHPLDHIEWAREADLVCVAPATADFLAKMAHGLADDLPSTLVSACDVPIVVAPAMNDRMWANPANQANLRTLRERGIDIIDPGSGYLACGTVAEGRLAEPEVICDHLLERLRPSKLAGRRVVITAGGSREAIDPVRFLGNRSSGRMGLALAEAARDRGARVRLILGPTDLEPPGGVEVQRFVSAADLAERVRESAGDADVLIMAAAVADFRPRESASEKIKKESGPPTLELEPTEDILAEVQRTRREGRIVVGFALETGSDRQVEEEARRKLEAKGLDLICGNRGDASGEGFESETNRLFLLDRHGQGTWTRPASKRELGRAVIDRILELETTPERSRGEA